MADAYRRDPYPSTNAPTPSPSRCRPWPWWRSRSYRWARMNTDKLRLRRCRIKQVCDSSAPSGSAKNLVKGANNAVDNKRVSGQSQTSKNSCVIRVYPRSSAADFLFTPMPERVQVRLRGIVQGVGFRPFVYNLAQRLNLAGYVLNDSSGLIAEVEGARAAIDAFLEALGSEHPPLAWIQNRVVTSL